MKRTLVGIVLAGLYATASAQGYMGAVMGLSKIHVDCGGRSPCDDRSKALKVYAGVQAKEGLVNNERFKLDTVEVSFIRFGTAKANTGGRTLTYKDEEENDVTEVASTRDNTKAHALTLAGVGRFMITPRLTASAKLGVAYVSTTVTRYVSDASDGSNTKNKFKPYLGLGLEFSVHDNVKFVASFDHTKLQTEESKGGLQMFGIGAQFGF